MKLVQHCCQVQGLTTSPVQGSALVDETFQHIKLIASCMCCLPTELYILKLSFVTLQGMVLKFRVCTSTVYAPLHSCSFFSSDIPNDTEVRICYDSDQQIHPHQEVMSECQCYL